MRQEFWHTLKNNVLKEWHCVCLPLDVTARHDGIDSKYWKEAAKWCEEQPSTKGFMGPCYTTFQAKAKKNNPMEPGVRWYFESEEDALLFSIRWSK